MIEILLKNKEIIKVNSTDDITVEQMDFYAIQFIDYTDEQIAWSAKNFGIDCSLMHRHEDIEISSHFLVKKDQTAFHISIPYYCANEEKRLIESPIFFIMCDKGLFFFSNSSIDQFFNKKYSRRFNELQEIPELNDILLFHIEVISDYFADITENEARQIKRLAGSVLLKNETSSKITDLITIYNFNNLLLKESLIETTRVITLYKKNVRDKNKSFKAVVDFELDDFSAISDYIQFNLDGLNNLRDNIKNKIDLEQNQVFRILTVITLCISLPALIAGVYGMNFINMPGMSAKHGFILVIVLMLFSAVIPYIYFKKKKWM